MKIFFSSVFTLVIISFLCFCSSSPVELISGTWSLEKLETDQKLSGQQRKAYDEAMKGLCANYTITYNKDFTYLTKSEYEQKGTWSLDGDGALLIQVGEDGSKTNCKIEELTADRLVISSKEGEVTNRMIFKKK